MQRITSLAAAAAATLLASAALAQMTGVADAQFETIVSVSPDGSAAVLQDAAGQQRTIVLDPGTSITRQGRPGTSATTIRLGDIGVGDRILVEGAARQGGFTAQRIQVFGPGVVSAPPPGVVSPGVSPGGANPASPPSGTGAPGGANPASPPSGTGAPDSSNPASPPPGSVRPGDPNTAAPGGSPANPASPPGGGGAGSNPAAPTTGGAGGAASPM